MNESKLSEFGFSKNSSGVYVKPLSDGYIYMTVDDGRLMVSANTGSGIACAPIPDTVYDLIEKGVVVKVD